MTSINIIYLTLISVLILLSSSVGGQVKCEAEQLASQFQYDEQVSAKPMWSVEYNPTVSSSKQHATEVSNSHGLNSASTGSNANLWDQTPKPLVNFTHSEAQQQEDYNKIHSPSTAHMDNQDWSQHMMRTTNQLIQADSRRATRIPVSSRHFDNNNHHQMQSNAAVGLTVPIRALDSNKPIIPIHYYQQHDTTLNSNPNFWSKFGRNKLVKLKRSYEHPILARVHFDDDPAIESTQASMMRQHEQLTNNDMISFNGAPDQHQAAIRRDYVMVNSPHHLRSSFYAYAEPPSSSSHSLLSTDSSKHSSKFLLEDQSSSPLISLDHSPYPMSSHNYHYQPSGMGAYSSHYGLYPTIPLSNQHNYKLALAPHHQRKSEKSLAVPILVGIASALVSFLILTNVFLALPLLAMAFMQFFNRDQQMIIPPNNNNNGQNSSTSGRGRRKKRDLIMFQHFEPIVYRALNNIHWSKLLEELASHSKNYNYK